MKLDHEEFHVVRGLWICWGWINTYFLCLLIFHEFDEEHDCLDVWESSGCPGFDLLPFCSPAHEWVPNIYRQIIGLDLKDPIGALGWPCSFVPSDIHTHKGHTGHHHHFSLFFVSSPFFWKLCILSYFISFFSCFTHSTITQFSSLLFITIFASTRTARTFLLYSWF